MLARALRKLGYEVTITPIDLAIRRERNGNLAENFRGSAIASAVTRSLGSSRRQASEKVMSKKPAEKWHEFGGVKSLVYVWYRTDRRQ
jgi:hypothetical protein